MYYLTSFEISTFLSMEFSDFFVYENRTHNTSVEKTSLKYRKTLLVHLFVSVSLSESAAAGRQLIQVPLGSAWHRNFSGLSLTLLTHCVDPEFVSGDRASHQTQRSIYSWLFDVDAEHRFLPRNPNQDSVLRIWSQDQRSRFSGLRAE